MSLAAAFVALNLCIVGAPSAQGTQTAGQTELPSTQTDRSPTAQAEQPSGSPRRAAEEEILVTGSRIRRKDLTTPAPITLISKEQIQASGKVSIGDFLQTLPEQGNALNTSVNNGNTTNGSTRVSLRGLGAERTLVLLNGRRFVPGGSGANGSVDLSTLPSAAIERIEVLKDGASAVYGSDAIGGVINLITRKRMNGVELSGYAGTSSQGDGTTYDLNAVAGTSGDRGNLLFIAGYSKQSEIWAGNRSYAAVPLGFSTTGIGVIGNQPGAFTVGSATTPAGTFALRNCPRGTPSGDLPPGSTPCRGKTIQNPNNDPKIAFYNNLISRFPGHPLPDGTPNPPATFVHTRANDPRDKVCDASGNCWRPFTTTQLVNEQDPLSGGDGYNFQPQNYLVTPQQRISLYSIGDTKLGNFGRGYFEGSYVNRQGGQTVAPTPLQLGSAITVSANNMYNPFGVDLPGVNRRLQEFNTRDFRQDIDTFRIVAGMDGTLPEEAGFIKGWYWDANFNFGRTVASNTKQGELFVSAVRDAVGPSMEIDGKPTCVAKPGDKTTAISGCVPLDLFHGEGSITPDQITPSIAYTGNQRGFNQLVAAQFNTSGELFQLLGERRVGLAAGYEYRIVSGQYIPDPITVAGLTTGNQIAITSGHYYVNEGYGEFSIPIVSGLRFAENIEATAAARLFNYSNFGTDYTYKFGGRWTVVRDFTLRGTYSTGFRAPSVPDLYTGNSGGFTAASDPCAGPGAGGEPIPQNCLNQGIPASGTGAPPGLGATLGGNPALQPEKAKIYTAGLVFEPRWIRGLSATVDYYNILIDKAIANIGAPLILSQCYPANPSAAPKYCELVQRDPATLRIMSITDINQNVASDATDGIDLALNYFLPTAVGRFNFNFDGTWLHKFDRTLVDGSVIHGKNTYDFSGSGSGTVIIGAVYPAFKFISSLRWAYAGLSAGVSTRFLSSFHECGSRNGLFNGQFGASTCYDREQRGDVGVNERTSRRVSAYNTWDLFLSYAFPTAAGKTTIGAGVNNVFNSNPPLIYNGFNGTSDPTAYDFVGRFFYGRVSHAF